MHYDPWGTPTVSGDGNSRLLWKGLVYEPGPAQGDVVGWWYDPQLGRFIQEDPVHSGVNDYVFAGDDPVNGKLSGEYGSPLFSRSHGDRPLDNQQIRQGLDIAKRGTCNPF